MGAFETAGAKKQVQVKVLRFDPSVGAEPRYQTYTVPIVEGMSVMDVLDYIYEHLDSTLAYYDHAACRQAICAKCSVVINGRRQLACQTPVDGDLVLEPARKGKVIRDLVCE